MTFGFWQGFVIAWHLTLLVIQTAIDDDEDGKIARAIGRLCAAATAHLVLYLGGWYS